MSGRKEELATLTKEEMSSYVAWLVKLWRSEFSPGPPQDCAVCGKYKVVCHAHHIYPLAWQARDGAQEADHSFVWLCPTHHACVHLILSENRMTRDIVIPPEDTVDVVKIGVRGLKMAGRLD